MGRRLTAGALTTTTALALSLIFAPGTPAIAADPTAPREVTVIPPDAPTVLPLEQIWFAGQSGFLHQHNVAKDYLWTRYDTGETVVVKDLAGVNRGALRPAGGDRVSIWGTVPTHPTDGTINVLDLGDLSWEQWRKPTDGTLYGIYGREMLVRLGEQLELRTVGADGSIVRTRPVTGLPAGETLLSDAEMTSDGQSSVVVEVGTMTGPWYGVIDVATAKAARIPDIDIDRLGYFKVSGDTVAWTEHDATVHAYSRAGLLDGTNTVGRTAKVGNNGARLAFVGDRVLGIDYKDDGRSTAPAVLAPLDGGAQTTVQPLAAIGLNSLIQGPDGTALLVGGTDWRDWAVRRLTPGDGTPTQVPVLPVRDPVETAALSYRHGVVRRLQSQVHPSTNATQYAVFHRNIAPDDGSGQAGGAVYDSGALVQPQTATCAPGANCVRMLDPGTNGIAYVSVDTSGATSVIRQTGTSRFTTAVPSTNGRLVDADDNYAIVNGGSPASQYVVDILGRKVIRTGTITAAALWYDTMWTTTGTLGEFKQLPLSVGGPALRTVATGATCAATELQVSARWLYWACGASGSAGAYDLTLKRSVALPAGPATLGDGFLVRHDPATGSLRMTDFHDGTARPEVKLADLPASSLADTRGYTWTVDRLGAGVAYADGDKAVHVLDTGVPSTPPTLGRVTSVGVANPTAKSPWAGYLRFTRPVSSWQVTVTRKSSGEAFVLASGGPVRDGANVAWSGWLPGGGGMAANGGYRWTATATVDGGATVTLGSGSFLSTCGKFPFRTWDCYGGQALLGVTDIGDGKWYGEAPQTEPAGHLYNLGTQDYWCLSCTGAARTSALVPFGDFNGDGLPDLLVRDGDGGMRAYLGNGSNGFAPSVTKSLSMGRGWMTYRSLLAPGDVTGDGRPDLLGVDKEGRLWLYALPGNGGVNPRVQVGSGWGIYPRVIGAGDLNGDGYGDLLGVDAGGVMYRYFSNGNKGWSGRVKVFSGWNIYNAVVPIGDLNQDGRHDLVARDAYGVLWFYAGLGNGSFAARVKAGSGWNMYKVIV